MKKAELLKIERKFEKTGVPHSGTPVSFDGIQVLSVKINKL